MNGSRQRRGEGSEVAELEPLTFAVELSGPPRGGLNTLMLISQNVLIEWFL